MYLYIFMRVWNICEASARLSCLEQLKMDRNGRNEVFRSVETANVHLHVYTNTYIHKTLVFYVAWSTEDERPSERCKASGYETAAVAFYVKFLDHRHDLTRRFRVVDSSIPFPFLNYILHPNYILPVFPS